jgi:hypothetical protein
MNIKFALAFAFLTGSITPILAAGGWKKDKVEICHVSYTYHKKESNFKTIQVPDYAVEGFLKGKNFYRGHCNENCATLCDDHNSCTIDDQDDCEEEGCIEPELRARVDCSDGVACTDDSCDPDEGCINIPDDEKCTEGEACTAGVCDTVEGDCRYDQILCNPLDVCSIPVCDEEEGCFFCP